jgi:hypothetical protein
MPVQNPSLYPILAAPTRKVWGQSVKSVRKVRLLRHWVKGLTAPKGHGLYKNKLYAAETKAVAVIDVSTTAVIQRIPVDGAEMLNDITIDEKGIVYVSDTRKNKVHKIENGKASVCLENMNNANGLPAKGNSIYINRHNITKS